MKDRLLFGSYCQLKDTLNDIFNRQVTRQCSFHVLQLFSILLFSNILSDRPFFLLCNRLFYRVPIIMFILVLLRLYCHFSIFLVS